MGEVSADIVVIEGRPYRDETDGLVSRNLQPVDGASLGSVHPEIRLVPDNPWAALTPDVARGIGYSALSPKEEA